MRHTKLNGEKERERETERKGERAQLTAAVAAGEMPVVPGRTEAGVVGAKKREKGGNL